MRTELNVPSPGYLTVIVSDTLEKAGIIATLSGGAAVSIYTDNPYQSVDLDFATTALVEDLEIGLFVREYAAIKKSPIFHGSRSKPLLVRAYRLCKFLVSRDSNTKCQTIFGTGTTAADSRAEQTGWPSSVVISIDQKCIRRPSLSGRAVPVILPLRTPFKCVALISTPTTA